MSAAAENSARSKYRFFIVLNKVLLSPGKIRHCSKNNGRLLFYLSIVLNIGSEETLKGSKLWMESPQLSQVIHSTRTASHQDLFYSPKTP
jgi:hypothetical protein